MLTYVANYLLKQRQFDVDKTGTSFFSYSVYSLSLCMPLSLSLSLLQSFNMNDTVQTITHFFYKFPNKCVEETFKSCCACQARIQEFTLVGAPWIGEGSGDRQGPQRIQGSARWGALGGRSPPGSS